MDVTRALQLAVKGYQHGSLSMAAAMNPPIERNTLLNKVNPQYSGAHCSPDEVMQIMQISGDHGALNAMADELGYVLLPMPSAASEIEPECTKRLLACVKEFGDFMTRVAETAEDGRIKDNELKDVEKEGAEAIAAIQHLIAWAAKKNQEQKPAHLTAAA